jgi:hypothetical protein
MRRHAGMPGNERAAGLTGMAAEMVSWSTFTSLAHLKLRVSKKFQQSKEEWDNDPTIMERRRSRPPHQKSHTWTRLGMPSLGRPRRSGPVTGAPRCISEI